ncbi:hypothetical protein PCE1_000427 [Barthelona sp. PCE]
MSKVIPTIILCALPASGKSEARRYLDTREEEVCRDFFHFGTTVQLDDYPYVHLSRVIDDALEEIEEDRLFFESADKSANDSRIWGFLVELLNEDYANLTRPECKPAETQSCYTNWLMARFDAARVRVGMEPFFIGLSDKIKAHLVEKVEEEAKQAYDDLLSNIPDTLEGKTVVIEFARGGPVDMDLPLTNHFGYEYSFGRLAPEILQNAGVLYIWVTPEQSRAKNRARADPNNPGSILNHGVPEFVMYNDYGQDDIEYMLEKSDKPHTVVVKSHGQEFYLPVGRFDNREDYTTFLRRDMETWTEEELSNIRTAMNKAIVEELWPAFNDLHQ